MRVINIQTGLGLRINLDTVSNISVQGNVITFSNLSGPTPPAVTVNNVDYVLTQISKAMAGNASYTAIYDTGVVILASVAPQPFSLANDTVTVFGTGFAPSMAAGLFRVEDAVGGIDTNGPSMQITYVSSTQVTAVLASMGDGSYDATSYFYYTDPQGNVASNVIYAQVTA
jgi:hypothetical protein